MLRRRVIGALLLGAAACGTEPAEGPGPGSPSSGYGAGGSIRELRIPRAVRSEATIWGIPVLEAGRFVLDTRLALAVGPGFPDTLEAVVPDEAWATCGRVAWDVALDGIETTGGSVGLELRPGGLVVRASSAGAEEVTLTGTVTLREPRCGLPAGAERPITITAEVLAIPVAGSRLRFDCPDASQTQLATGQPFPTEPRLELLDPAGAPISAANVDAYARDDLVLRSELDLGIDPPARFADWVAPDAPGTVEIEPSLGDAVTVRVVGPESVVDADVEFRIGHIKAEPTPVAAGGVYRPADLLHHGSAATNGLAPHVAGLATARGPLCSSPPARWFELASNTPQICEVLPSSRSDSAPWGEARLLRDGTCELELRAPALAPEAGFPVRWRATFQDVDELFGF